MKMVWCHELPWLMATHTTYSFMQMKMAVQSRSGICDTPNWPIKTVKLVHVAPIPHPPCQSTRELGLLTLGTCNATLQQYRNKSPFHHYHILTQKISASHLAKWSYQTIRTQQSSQLCKRCTYLSVTLQCKWYMQICVLGLYNNVKVTAVSQCAMHTLHVCFHRCVTIHCTPVSLKQPHLSIDFAARSSLTYLYLILIFTNMVMATNHKHTDSL
jgi:hypothetical protein